MMFAKLRVYMRIFWLCLKWTMDLNLGDIVRYNGKRYELIQGVCRPLWTLCEVGKCGREFIVEYVHEKDFRKERTLRNYWHDITSCYHFFKGYWFDIWVREIQEPGCFDDILKRNSAIHVWAILACLIGLNGCEKKVTPEQRALLATATLAAKERASSFAVIKKDLKPVDPAKKALVDKLLNDHGASLNAQALALQKFGEDIDKDSTLSDRAIETIGEMAKTATARAACAEANAGDLALTEEQLAWAADHTKALKAQAEKLTELAEKLKPKKPTPQTGPPAEAPK